MSALVSKLDVPCTSCNAARCEPCTQSTDASRRPVTWVHLAREDAYKVALEGEGALRLAIEDVRDALPTHDLFDPNLTLSRAVRRLLAALEWNTQAKGDQL